MAIKIDKDKDRFYFAFNCNYTIKEILPLFDYNPSSIFNSGIGHNIIDLHSSKE